MIWNKQALLKRVRNREDRAKILIGMYFDDTPQQIEELSIHMEAKDFASVSKMAHAIKGVAANLGAEQCQKSAQDIETFAVSTNTEELKGMFEVLVKDIDAFNIKLKEYLSNPAA